MEFDNTYLFFILMGIIAAFFLAWENPLENWENEDFFDKLRLMFIVIVGLAGFLALVLQILDLIKG